MKRSVDIAISRVRGDMNIPVDTINWSIVAAVATVVATPKNRFRVGSPPIVILKRAALGGN
jgi:hypothetical protein